MTDIEALELTVELWEWLAETGKSKPDWPRFEEIKSFRSYCPLCELGLRSMRGENPCAACVMYGCWGTYVKSCSTFARRGVYDLWCDAQPMTDTCKQRAAVIAQRCRIRLEELKAIPQEHSDKTGRY